MIMIRNGRLVSMSAKALNANVTDLLAATAKAVRKPRKSAGKPAANGNASRKTNLVTKPAAKKPMSRGSRLRAAESHVQAAKRDPRAVWRTMRPN